MFSTWLACPIHIFHMFATCSSNRLFPTSRVVTEMKKAVLSIGVLSALAFSTVSGAAPSIGANGIISFAGGLNAETCSVQDGSAVVAGNNLSYEMGMVSTNSLGTEAAPATPASSGSLASPTNMNLRLLCAAGSSVELTLTPPKHSGKGIAVSGDAKNVQIMLVQGSSVLDFMPGSVTLPAPLSGGVANIALKAYYTLQAGKTVSDVIPGSANGSIAYVLSYN